MSDLSDVVDVDVDNSRAEATQPDLVVAKDENRWVWRLRFLVACVLMSATIVVGVGVYLGGRNGEQDDFENDFAGLADKLVVSFQSAVKQRFGAIDMFTSGMTANANETWPLVTPPAFTRRMTELHSLVGLSFSTVAVRVEEDRRREWLQYSVANQGWLQEGLAYTMGENLGDIVTAPTVPEIIDLFNSKPGELTPDTGPGPYYPVWMLHPPRNQSFINVNMHRNPEYQGIMDFVVANRKPAFPASVDYIDPTRPKDKIQYDLLTTTPDLDYQDDAFAYAQFPGKQYSEFKQYKTWLFSHRLSFSI
ncbi:MAG: hypothetical protein SGBAC_012705 [Bacillariaceae sp.]